MTPQGRPLRVLYFVANFHRYTGSQRSLHLLLGGLDRSRVETLVVFPGEGPCTAHYRESGVPVRVIEAPEVLNRFGGEHLRAGPLARAWTALTAAVPYGWRLGRLIREERIDLVHFNDARGLLMAGAGAAAARVPVVWHVRGDVRALGPVYLAVCGLFADRIVLVADGIRGSLPARLARRCVTVYNGIDLPSAPPRRHLGALLSSLSPPVTLPEGEVLAVVVGSVVPFKGAHHAIEAVRRVRASAPMALVFVGDRPDAGYARVLDAAVGAAAPIDVCFAGWDDDPLDWIRAADLVILPTVEKEVLAVDGERRTVRGTEGFSRTVLEAMACGRPVVASAVAGVPEQVADGETGILVPPSDPGALAAALERLAGDAELRRRLGEAGTRRVAERFSVRTMVEETMRVYAELVGGGS